VRLAGVYFLLPQTNNAMSCKCDAAAGYFFDSSGMTDE